MPAQMYDVGRAVCELEHRIAVEHVSLVQLEVRMLGQLGPRQRFAVEVVHRRHVVPVDEPPGQRGADEAGAAGDQDAFAADRHFRAESSLEWMGLVFRRQSTSIDEPQQSPDGAASDEAPPELLVLLDLRKDLLAELPRLSYQGVTQTPLGVVAAANPAQGPAPGQTVQRA
jgi:hypothetical protein